MYVKFSSVLVICGGLGSTDRCLNKSLHVLCVCFEVEGMDRLKGKGFEIFEMSRWDCF